MALRIGLLVILGLLIIIGFGMAITEEPQQNDTSYNEQTINLTS